MSWGMFRRHTQAAAALGALLAAAVSCSRERLVQGECQSVNGAQVCSWGRLAGSQVVAFGATVPVRAAEAAPADLPMAWPPKADATVPLPAEVKAALGFDNITIFWEPHGHPPGPYLVPHFDFHFNAIPSAQVAAIDCADSTKPANPPAGYELPDATIPPIGTLIGICVPGMGMHALPSAELRSATPFEKTMIVGYYHRSPIVVEPMITRATLLARRTFEQPIPPVSGWSAGVQQPSVFRAAYDSTAQAYQFTFTGFARGTN